jgi:hypothetical protein
MVHHRFLHKAFCFVLLLLAGSLLMLPGLAEAG